MDQSVIKEMMKLGRGGANWLNYHQHRKPADLQLPGVERESWEWGPLHPNSLLFLLVCHFTSFCLIPLRHGLSLHEVLGSPSSLSLPHHSTRGTRDSCGCLNFELRHLCLCSKCSYTLSSLPSYLAPIFEMDSHCI